MKNIKRWFKKVKTVATLWWACSVACVFMKQPKCKDGFKMRINNGVFDRTYWGIWDKETKTYNMEIVEGIGVGTQVKMNLVQMYEFIFDAMWQAITSSEDCAFNINV